MTEIILDMDREKCQLDAAVATIQGRYGPWALVRGRPAPTSDRPIVPPHVPTGFPRLDRVLEIGGLPKGRVCEVLGPTTSGKTTLALTFLAQAQRDGGQVGYIDQAIGIDPGYAHRCGLDLSRLLVGMTPDLPEALSMLEALAVMSSPASGSATRSTMKLQTLPFQGLSAFSALTSSTRQK